MTNEGGPQQNGQPERNEDRVDQQDILRNGQPNAQQNVQPTAVNRIQVRVPPFWKQNPRLWFRQLEAQFANSTITSELTKFNTIVGVVESDILSSVSDLVLNPPTGNQYETIKQRLIKEFEETESKKLRSLFNELSIGDTKPSTLLRRMRELSCGKVGEELLKTLWLQRLPVNIQTVLATSGDDLTQLSATADVMFDISEPVAVQAVTQINQIDDLVSIVDRLDGKIELLSRDFHKSRKSNQRTARSRQTTPVRASSASNKDFCFYHKAFGNKAQKCRSPCAFKKSKSEN